MDVRRRTTTTTPGGLWSQRYESCSFRFDVDSYRGKRSSVEQREIIDSFSYLGLLGPIKLNNDDDADDGKTVEKFCVFEDWPAVKSSSAAPKRVYMGRWLANGSRDQINVYNLKKRDYIARTSMDSELALITANLALAGPGKMMYDPFVGTGSFPIASAHFGAMTLGSDIDGRTIRGSSKGVNILGNFQQYHLESRWVNGFIADLTNTPVRKTTRWLDGILCDPPYGVREGLRVLGRRDPEKGREEVMVNGKPSHM